MVPLLERGRPGAPSGAATGIFAYSGRLERERRRNACGAQGQELAAAARFATAVMTRKFGEDQAYPS